MTTKPVWPVLLTVFLIACSGSSTKLTELQRVKSGGLEIVVLSPNDALKHGKDTLVIEFRSSDGTLVDVGEVKGGASMSMSGTPMLGSVDVKRGVQTGQYIAATQLDMAGTWRLTLEWKGPAGSGSASFSGNVL
jgi:YtkA-like protein